MSTDRYQKSGGLAIGSRFGKSNGDDRDGRSFSLDGKSLRPLLPARETVLHDEKSSDYSLRRA